MGEYTSSENNINVSTQTDERTTYKYLQWKALPTDKNYLQLKRSFSQLRYCDCVCHQLSRSITAGEIPPTRHYHHLPKHTETDVKRTSGRPPLLPKLDSIKSKEAFQRSKSFIIDGKVRNKSSLLVDPDGNNDRKAMKSMGSQYIGLALSINKRKNTSKIERIKTDIQRTFLECSGTKIDGSVSSDSKKRSFESEEDEDFNAVINAIRDSNAINTKENVHHEFDKDTFKIWKVLPKGKTKKTQGRFHKINAEEVSLSLDYKNNYQPISEDDEVAITDLEECNKLESKTLHIPPPEKKAVLTVHIPTLPVIHPSMLKRCQTIVPSSQPSGDDRERQMVPLPQVTEEVVLPQVTETDVTISKAMELLKKNCPPTPVAPPCSPTGPRQRPRRASHGELYQPECDNRISLL